MRRHSGSAKRAQILAGISQQQNTRHALGILGGEIANDAHDDVGLVLAVGTTDRNQPAVGVQIVLDEIAGRKFRLACPPAKASAF